MGNQKEIMQDSLKAELRAYFREYAAIQNSVDLHDELFKMTPVRNIKTRLIHLSNSHIW